MICKRGRKSYKGNQEAVLHPIKPDLDMLKWAAWMEEIDWIYLDKSGLDPWTEPGYSYYQRGDQKLLQ